MVVQRPVVSKQIWPLIPPRTSTATESERVRVTKVWCESFSFLELADFFTRYLPSQLEVIGLGELDGMTTDS